LSIAYKIAVLVYMYNSRGELLLLHRRRPPNRDLYSPIGGKLEQGIGESPYACVLREVHEEAGLALSLADIKLLGIVSERAFPGSTPSGGEDSGETKTAPAHWLMFCFEVTRPVEVAAREINEGRLEWHPLAAIAQLGIPKTDREVIWPLVRQHSTALGGKAAHEFFSVHIDCTDAENFKVTHEHPRAGIRPDQTAF
jgi:8-oxo-dGTP diphosphatase